MEKKKLEFKEQEEKSIKENLELLNRINKLKNQALKLMKIEGVEK